MANTVPLDNVAHRDLRVRTGFSAEFGDAVNLVLVFPTEFALVQREYPILFRRDAEGAWQAVALLGLDKGENLFLDGQRWKARWVPAVQQRGPFLIGLHARMAGDPDAQPMVHVDLDHPRVSRDEGEPVFLPHGGNSPCLERASRVLQMIYHGAPLARAMFAAFESAGLLETIDLKVSLDGNRQYTVPGFHTINADRLAALDGATLQRLNAAGHLQLAYFAMASLGNIEWLIELKNRKHAA